MKMPCRYCGEPTDIGAGGSYADIVDRLLRTFGVSAADVHRIAVCLRCYPGWRQEQRDAVMAEWKEDRAEQSLRDYEALAKKHAENPKEELPDPAVYFSAETHMRFREEIENIQRMARRRTRRSEGDLS